LPRAESAGPQPFELFATRVSATSRNENKLTRGSKPDAGQQSGASPRGAATRATPANDRQTSPTSLPMRRLGRGEQALGGCDAVHGATRREPGERIHPRGLAGVPQRIAISDRDQPR